MVCRLRNLLILFGVLWMTNQFRIWRRNIVTRLTRRSRIAHTPHGDIEYVLRGQGEPVVLLLHGSPGGCDFWHMYQDVVAMGYRVLSPSRPGYLRTPLTSGRTLAEQCQLIVSLLDMLHIETVTVIGFSGGAPLAFQLALDSPQRIQSLVIESGVTHRIDITDTPEEWLLNIIHMTALVQRPLYWIGQWMVHRLPGLVLWLTFWFTTSHSWRETWHCMRYIVRSPKQLRLFWHLFDANLPFSQRQTGYTYDIRILETLPDFDFERIKQPVLFLHSHYDEDVPLEHAESALARISNAQSYIVDGCGHFIWLGAQRQQVIERRNQFIKSHHFVADADSTDD